MSRSVVWVAAAALVFAAAAGGARKNPAARPGADRLFAQAADTGICGTKWQVNLGGLTGSQGMVLQINGTQINDKALGWGAMPFRTDAEGTPQVPESGLPLNAWNLD